MTDFTHFHERRSTNSIKWAMMPEDVLPLWIADADFPSPPAVIEALQARAQHGIFGYQVDSPTLRTLIVERLARLYGWTIEGKDITFIPGLVTAMNVVAEMIGEEGDGMLTLTPIYPPFLETPHNQRRELQTAALSLTTLANGQRRYALDMDALERAVTPRTRLLMLCNPHNPIGRVWRKEELQQLGDFCLKHDLYICSDEIHCDLLLDDHTHIPIATLSPELAQRTITLMAPSKTFNIPGLALGFAISQNTDIQARLFQLWMSHRIPLVTVFGFTAAEAAYAHGEVWLQEYLAHIAANRALVYEFMAENLPQVGVTQLESTYLMWLDFRPLNLPDVPAKFLLEQARVGLNDGKTFGADGEGFVRLNLACTRAVLLQALERIHAAVQRVREGTPPIG
jgi:cysteine-S-conjugate beta-lyase